MRITHLLITWLIFSVSICLHAEDQQQDYVIIKADEEARLIFEQCSRMTPTFRTGYRELNEETVKKIELILPAALQEAAKGQSIDLDSYKRQYVAFEMLRKELVYINAFDKEAIKQWAAQDPANQELLDSWQSRAITVCGGGQSYWGAIYDSQNDHISELLFNSKVHKKR